MNFVLYQDYIDFSKNNLNISYEEWLEKTILEQKEEINNLDNEVWFYKNMSINPI